MAPVNDQRSPLGALFALWILCFATAVSSSPALGRSDALGSRQLPGSAISPYAPTAVACPNTPLVRSGRSISADEKAWAAKRHVKTSAALKAYLAKQGDFPVLDTYPTLGLANGGGGIRGFLTSAGNHLAFDSREGENYTTAGLLDAFSYEAALSGSSIMLGSYVESGFKKTTELYQTLWKEGMVNGLFMPDGPTGSGPALAGITADLLAKLTAGAPVSLTDALGRLFGYVAFANEADGPAGIGKKLSDSLELDAYKNHEAPLPFFISLGVEQPAEGCGLPPQNATQYEFSPFEFGSFNDGVKSFTPTKYLGSTLTNGKPSSGLLGDKCLTGFDNSNFIVGCSTAIFNQFCGTFVGTPADAFFGNHGLQVLEGILDPVLGESQIPLFSLIPNYAYKYAKSPKVSSLSNLMLVDGGENIQVIPTWPLIWRKDMKVMFLTDSSTYGLGKQRINLPNGRSLYNSMVQAKAEGVGNRFPVIPGPEVFLKKGLVDRVVFFGCDLAPEDPAMTIVYAPNKKYTYNSAVKTNQNKYTAAESLGLLLNGAQVATNGNDPDYGFCAGCVTIKRQAQAEGKALPAKCKACFKKYCYN